MIIYIFSQNYIDYMYFCIDVYAIDISYKIIRITD